MDQHVVVGTAGHVDHGKTALVKALTGTDTDRWEEEKRRGITIDLGFAAMSLDAGLRASIVDVPGHEDFVRNMVAGATGVDVALLVVAADEGVMPQTVEHLAILQFLEVASGVVALTKADLVEPDWLDLVAADVGEHLAGSGIAWEPPVAVSSVTGTGVDRLKDALAAAARRSRVRAVDDLFRMPIDRVFAVAGAGTVVTGTTWSGAIAVGEEILVLPAGERARVRGIEVHGETRERAEPGRRTALALAGLDRRAAARGSVVVADASWRATTALDVLVTLLPGARPLTQRSLVRLHLGTAEVLARLTPLEQVIRPGERAPARLRLAEPAVSRWGDRGVLRSASPVTTVGGCVVVDPWPAERPRRPVAAAARAVPDPNQRLRAFVDLVDGRVPLRVADLRVRLGLHPGQADDVIRSAAAIGILRVGDALVSQTAETARYELAREALERHHRERPLEAGMPLELWRKELGGADLARSAEAELVSTGTAVIEGAFVRLAAHRPQIPGALRDAAERARAALAAAGREGRTPAELDVGVTADSVQQLLEYFVRDGTALRVGRDRYYLKPELERLRELTVQEITRRGQATPAELREVLGLSRKYLIPLLEWLDAAGVTVRAGDARRLGPAAHQRE